MTVKEIITKFLDSNGYDGLYDGLYDDTGECSCKKDDLIACGDYCGNCRPGFMHLDNDEYDFYIKSEQESIDSVKGKY